MAKKGVLGKGLNALLPEEDPDQEAGESGSTGSTVSDSKLYRFKDRDSSGRVAEIPVESIQPNPYQPRQDFDEEALDELASSIEKFGLIQPITVRVTDEKEFEIISGERRLRAARRASISHVPAFIRTAGSEEMLEMALIENLQREDLNPVEIALGYQRLMDECGLTHQEVAEKVDKNRSTVTNMVRLLRLPPRVQTCLRDQSISQGHARMLINLDNEELQLELLDKILAEGLTVREVETLVRQHKKQQNPAPSADDEPAGVEAEPEVEASSQPDRTDLQVKDLTDKLRTRFSTQVRVQHNTDGSGKIELAYYSADDLERLFDLLLNA
jgi:ParB family chromosome partitioning protein